MRLTGTRPAPRCTRAFEPWTIRRAPVLWAMAPARASPRSRTPAPESNSIVPAPCDRTLAALCTAFCETLARLGSAGTRRGALGQDRGGVLHAILRDGRTSGNGWHHDRSAALVPRGVTGEDKRSDLPR